MKQKTKKAAKKRFTFTGTGKAPRRHIGQAHFNGRNTVDQTRRKHGANTVDATDRARVTRLLPYN